MKAAFKAAMFFVLSFQAMAHGHDMIFKGLGHWKNKAGEEGDYSLLLKTTVLTDGSMKTTTTIDKGDEGIMTFTTKIKKDERGFLTVFDKYDHPIGRGHSHDMGKFHVCHYEMTIGAGEKVEITVHGNLDSFQSIGSYSNDATDSYVTWTEQGDRIYPTL